MSRGRAGPCIVAALILGGCPNAGLLQLDASGSGSGGGEGSSQGETEGSGTGAPDPGQGCWESPVDAPVFHVAPEGNDASGDGSTAAPWASIAVAVATVPDGAVIEVAPGDYVGPNALVGRFDVGVVVRARPPYRARLRAAGPVVTLADITGLTLEGFDIAHTANGADPYVVHIRDDIGEPGGSEFPTRIVLRDNIIHDSYNNDLVKIDSGVAGIELRGNLFYNQGALDEHIDINAASDVTLHRNIFLNDFGASGRQNTGDTSSFVIVKDADGSADGISGSSGVTIDANIFMGWQGDAGSNFVLLAERGNPIYGASNILVQNNLMLGNGLDPMRAPFGVKGATGVVFRSNTVVGDLPANAFAFRLNVEGDSPPNDGIEFFNNIWSDPTATMDDLTDTEPVNALENFAIDTNLYWNGGQPVPEDSTDTVNVTSDANAVVGDPALAEVTAVNPTWDPGTMRFGGGATTICASFDALVANHGTPAATGAGVAAGLPGQLPALDILGRDRLGADIGALAAP